MTLGDAWIALRRYLGVLVWPVDTTSGPLDPRLAQALAAQGFSKPLPRCVIYSVALVGPLPGPGALSLNIIATGDEWLSAVKAALQSRGTK
jgi:hypothetical protein